MRDAKIDLDFADGHYDFKLGWKELISLQERLEMGPYMIQKRLLLGEWRIQDLAEVIRWGLIGGGLTAPEATKLVRLYVERQPPMSAPPGEIEKSSLGVASAVIAAALIGAPEENAKLGEAGRGEAKRSDSMISPTADGASPLSSASQPSSESSPASS